MVYVKSPKGSLIQTELSPEIEKIIGEEGYSWFDGLHQEKPLDLSEEAFEKINALISP